MTFPTKNTQGDPLTPVDVLVQLMDGPAEEVRLVSKKPGKGGAIVSETRKFRIHLLTQGQQVDALIAARKFATENGESGEQGPLFRERQAIEVVARALHAAKAHPKPGGGEGEYFPRAYTNTAHLLQSLYGSDLSYLLNVYEKLNAMYSPLLDLDDAEIEEWASRLSGPGEFGGAFFLGRLDSSHWPGLLLSFAETIRSQSLELGRPLRDWTDLLESSESSNETSSDGTTSPSGLRNRSTAASEAGESSSVETADGMTAPETLDDAKAQAKAKLRKQDK